jgi:hypothetical protein
MQFKVFQYADISTAYLDPRDLDLLTTALGHIAQLDGGVGDFFAVPAKENDSEPLDDWKARVIEHGLSQRFLDIMLALREQEIPYVRFDRDGGFLEGCEPTPEFAGAV